MARCGRCGRQVSGDREAWAAVERGNEIACRDCLTDAERDALVTRRELLRPAATPALRQLFDRLDREERRTALHGSRNPGG